jgi:hypothetical protein
MREARRFGQGTGERSIYTHILGHFGQGRVRGKSHKAIIFCHHEPRAIIFGWHAYSLNVSALHCGQ